MTEPSRASLDFAWALYHRIAGALAKPLDEVRTSVQRATEPPDLVAAAEPSHFQRACLLGLASVTDIALDERLLPAVRTALRELPKHYQEILTVLLPAAQALSAAAPDLRNIQHIEGMSAVLFQATQAANPSTPVGVAAIGGATLGTLLLPGIGTAIGGALGVLLGGTQANKRDRRALERFAAAVKLMWAATEDLHNNLWNQIIHLVQEDSGPTLPDAAYFETASALWESIKSAPQATPRPGDPAPFRDTVEKFIRDWGPHPEALYVVAQACLPPYPLDLAALESWVEKQVQLYPTDAGTHENSARLALERADFARSLESADRGLAVNPNHGGLRQVHLEAQAALGRVADAEEAVRQARTTSPASLPELPFIRGLIRGGRTPEAAERVRAWVKRDGKPALIVQYLKTGAVTASLFGDGPILLPELTGYAAGSTAPLQAAVEQHLRADNAVSFFGEPPGDKGRNAREAFLHLRAEEKVLYFHDWSLWHNAKTGLALTNQRLLWKCAWQDTVEVELRDVPTDAVSVKGSVLHIGDKTIDMEDEALAMGLMRTLRERGTEAKS